MNAVINMPKLFQITGKQNEDRFEKNLKIVKKAIESGCHYYPLDFNRVFNQFVEDEMIQKILGQNNSKKELEDTIKDFLLKQAYFSLESEEFIPKILHKISNYYALQPELFPDMLDYVRNELEKKNLKRIKGFNGQSKFTTYLYTVTRNLVLNFLDKINRMNEAGTASTGDIIQALHELDFDPVSANLQSEKEEIMQKIAEIIETLSAKEKVIFKMFYYENVNVSEIAAAFAFTWHKANKLLKSATSTFLTQLRKTKYFPHLNLRCRDLIKRIKKLRRQK